MQWRVDDDGRVPLWGWRVLLVVCAWCGCWFLSRCVVVVCGCFWFWCFPGCQFACGAVCAACCWGVCAGGGGWCVVGGCGCWCGAPLGCHAVNALVVAFFPCPVFVRLRGLLAARDDRPRHGVCMWRGQVLLSWCWRGGRVDEGGRLENGSSEQEPGVRIPVPPPGGGSERPSPIGPVVQWEHARLSIWRSGFDPRWDYSIRCGSVDRARAF